MRKKIFYPSVINKDEESLVTQEEYRDQLSDIYSTQEHNLPEYLISNLIGSIQHEIKNSVGRTFACYPNAARSAQAIKSLSELSVEEMKERYSENRQLGYIFPIAILYKGEPESSKRILDNRHGIRNCDDQIISMATELTQRIVDDVEITTKSQLTHVERFAKPPRRPDENKASWANRVSAEAMSSNLEQKSPSNSGEGKSIKF